MDLSTRLRTLALRRISSREPFSATDLAAEAVGAAPTVDALRSAYATAAEVCSEEFLHAAGYQRQVTPGGLRFEPIPTGPTRLPAIAYERAVPPFPVASEQPVPAWLPTAPNIRAQGRPTGASDRLRVAKGLVGEHFAFVDVEWQGYGVPSLEHEQAWFLRMRSCATEERLGRVLLDGRPLLLETHVRLVHRFDRHQERLWRAFSTPAEDEVVCTDLLHALSGGVTGLSRLDRGEDSYGFAVEYRCSFPEADYDAPSGSARVALAFEAGTLRGKLVFDYECDEGQFTRPRSPLALR